MAEAKWYVVHTYSGYENKVKANIEKSIQNLHLEDQILSVEVPMEGRCRSKKWPEESRTEKALPGLCTAPYGHER